MRNRRRGWRIAGWILLPVAAAIQYGTPSDLAERRYARSLYPHIARAFSVLNDGVGFSLAEVLLVLLLAASGAAVVWVCWPRPGFVRRLLSAVGGVLAIAGLALALFTGLWGLNYRRPPLARRLGMPTGGTPAELAAATRWLAGETARFAPPGAPDQPTRLPYSRRVLETRIEEAYARAAELDTHLPGPLAAAKPILCSGIMARLGLSGVFVPFTGEPNYNRLQPDAELVFAIAHEKAHQRGFAPENEASFAAFLALQASSDPYLRYCAFLTAAGSALRAVYRTDPDAFPALNRLLQGRPNADRARIYAFWAQYRGPAEKVSARVNDLYLRANRVPGGIRSYDAVTDLLVGYYRQHPPREAEGKRQ